MEVITQKHKYHIILSTYGGTDLANNRYGFRYDLSKFFNQLPNLKQGQRIKLAGYYFHFGSSVGSIDTLNVELLGFTQDKNRSFYSVNRPSNTIMTIGNNEGTNSFNVYREDPHEVEGVFDNSYQVEVYFIDAAGNYINWSPSTNDYQLNLILEWESKL